MIRDRNTIRIISIVVATTCLSVAPTMADKLDPDLLPPDITLPSPNATSRVTTSAAPSAATPGLPGGSTTPGRSGAAPPQNSATDAHNSSMFHLPSKPDPSKPDPIAIINTGKGTIKIRLFRQLAPLTVANFVDLVSKGFYNGLIFHRIEPGFCIQGGCPYGTGLGSYIDPATHLMRFLPLEVSARLRHNAPGVVAMAHSQSLDSGSCQFYITMSPQPHLDGKYSIFGGVLNGMDVVQRMAKGDKINSITVQETQ